MIKVGNVVEYYGNVGTVRRVLSDDNGSMAMVQWIGSNVVNLKPIEVDKLTLCEKPFYSQLCEVINDVHTMFTELRSSTTEDIHIEYLDEVEQMIFEYEENFEDVLYGNKTD